MVFFLPVSKLIFLSYYFFALCSSWNDVLQKSFDASNVSGKDYCWRFAPSIFVTFFCM